MYRHRIHNYSKLLVKMLRNLRRFLCSLSFSFGLSIGSVHLGCGQKCLPSYAAVRVAALLVMNLVTGDVTVGDIQ